MLVLEHIIDSLLGYPYYNCISPTAMGVMRCITVDRRYDVTAVYKVLKVLHRI
jgi:hypothetical protein